MADSLYPIRLGYTLPSGKEYSVVITNEDQSEDEYDKMFSLCGHDIRYSVDEVKPFTEIEPQERDEHYLTVSSCD